MRIVGLACFVFLFAGCAPSSVPDESSPGDGGGGSGPSCRFTALEDLPGGGGAPRPSGGVGGGAPFVTQWVSSLGTAGIVDIAVDDRDTGSDVLIAGVATGELDLGDGVKLHAPANGGGFVAKLDPLGHPAWVAAAPLTNFQIKSDGDGGAWVTRSGAADDSLRLRHFDALGHEIARTKLPLMSGEMVSTGDGGVIVAGRTADAADFGNGVGVGADASLGDAGLALVAFDHLGEPRWARSLAPLFWSDPGPLYSRTLELLALAPGPGGGATILLDAEDSDLDSTTACAARAWLLARFNGDGSLVWSRRMPKTVYAELAVDAAGDTLMMTNEGGLTLDMFDPAGQPRWSTRFALQGEPLRPVFDASGNIFLAGDFGGEVDFGGGPLKASGDYRLFVAELSPEGRYLTSRTFAASFALGADTRPYADDRGEAVIVHPNGSLLFAGEYVGNLDLGVGSLPPVPEPASPNGTLYGAFLARIAP